MVEDWLAGYDEEEDNSSSVYFSGEHVWIQGVHLSSFSCPVCLEGDDILEFGESNNENYPEGEICIGEESNCFLCEFFEPDTCLLLRDPDLLDDLRTIFYAYRQRHTHRYQRYLDNRQVLVKAIISELKDHGRPLHYTVLADMLTNRYPDLRIRSNTVLRIMSHRPHIFIKVDEGVYRCWNSPK